MGCKGSKPNIEYNYHGKTRKIPLKDAGTLERWSYGAKARLLVMRRKRELMAQITSLKKPCLVDG